MASPHRPVRAQSKACRGAGLFTLRCASIFMLGIIASASGGCGGGGGGGTPGETGGASSGGSGEPEELDCGAHLPLVVEMGEGIGASFIGFEEGTRLRLEFASQAGLEAAVSVRTMGLLPEDIDSIDLTLSVDGSPIGESSTSSTGLRCEGLEFARVDTSLSIDVTSHPTIVSVPQLDEVPADLHVAIVDTDGVLVEHSVEVVLEP